MTEPMFVAFVATSLVLAVTPGPGVVYIVARTAAQGRRAGLACVVGVALGNLGNAVAASLGLAAVLAVSATAFDVVKWAGAAYLVYLGLRTLAPPRAADLRWEPGRPAVAGMLREGFAVALLNPKTTLFFAALLPQFLPPSGPAALYSVALATVFVAIALLTDTAYVLAAHAARSRMAGSVAARRFGRYVTAATLVGLGVFAALSGSRGTR